MADLLFIAVTVAFFGLALVLVRACDRIIGPDTDLHADADLADDGVDATAEEVEV